MSNHKFVITIVAEAHDGNVVAHHASGDNVGRPVTEHSIQSYLNGAHVEAGVDLAPGITVESVDVTGVSDSHLSRYQELEADSRKLARLEAAGVDNWEGYSVAMRDCE